MKRNFLNLVFSMVASFVLLGAWLVPVETFSQDYCIPSVTYPGQYMGVDYILIDDMVVKKGWENSQKEGYSLYDDEEYKMNYSAGDVLKFDIGFGATYYMTLTVFADWNLDGKFDAKTELVGTSGNESSLYGFNGEFQIPDDAESGEIRIRFMTEYEGYTYLTDPCQSITYGETIDLILVLAPKSPDASIISLNSPAKPFRVGEHNITATLKSGNKATLQTCWIDWWVNDVAQKPVFWKGNLDEGQTEKVDFGTMNLDYPMGEKDFGPFRFRFTTRAPNGFEVDADPSNDTYVSNISPILNDAGISGFFGPAEGFGPGVTQVRARVRNYAPKPLTRLTINWSIDDEEQTPITISGLNIPRDGVQDINIGTYNFYAKTPLGPFTVDCYSTNPNGVRDEDESNDSYSGGIGPSLAAGVYTVGGSQAHFSSPSEASSYINSSGVFGSGKVTFMVNPGTYNGQIEFTTALPNRNSIEFIGNGKYNNDVVITANSTAQNNFIVLIDGFFDIAFENMTFANNNNNNSNAGNIFTIRNTNGFNLTNTNIMGVPSSPRSNMNYVLLNLSNSTNINLRKNDFNNGSAAFYSVVNQQILPTMNISDNFFFNSSWLGIHNQLANGIKVGNVVIHNNKFISNSGLAPLGGIASWNSTTITGNEFTGIVGNGANTGAAIFVQHNTRDASNVAEIVGNKINGASNVNGILVNGAVTHIERNYISTNQTNNAYGLASLKIMNAEGLVGNNQIIGREMNSLNISGSSNLGLYYNSVLNESASLPTAVVSGSADLRRNIIVNNSTGSVYSVTGSVISDENMFNTNGNLFGSMNGAQIGSFDNWQERGLDQSSSFGEVEFESTNDLHIKYYNPDLLVGSPLFEVEAPESGVESNDYDGFPRQSYFIGSHELALSISLARQTDGFVDCEGATENFLTVSATIDYNAPMTYQWEHDGVAIPGEIQPILYFPNLRHTQSGVYRCKVDGPGNTQSIYSRPVSIFTARPTEIIRQPENTYAPSKGLATLSFDAHVNGLKIETAIANNEVRVQWYKYMDESNSIPLLNNKFISGAQSNYLTFRDFKKSDEGEYYAIVEGLCGTVRTDIVSINESILDIEVIIAPESMSRCEGASVSFTVEASTSSPYTLLYQWYKDGAELSNSADISGVNTNVLTINDLKDTDRGDYTVRLNLDIDGSTVEQERTATLKVGVKPLIPVDLEDITVELGKDFTLSVVAEGSDDEEVLVYKWYKDFELIYEGEELTVTNVTEEDAGIYYVEVSNNCFTVRSNDALVLVTTGVALSVNEVSEAGFSLGTASPNPVSASSIVTFTVPTDSYVKITLTDASGASRVILAEGNYTEGTHSINVDSQSLNLVSGTYFYYLESNGVRIAQKMVVIR